MKEKNIEIIDEYGHAHQAEIIFKYYSQEYKKCYIVYSLNEDEKENVCYAASFSNVEGLVELDNNLNEKELMLMQNLVNQMKE